MATKKKWFNDEKGINKQQHTRLVYALIPVSVQVAQLIRCVDDDVSAVGVQNCVCWSEASDFNIVEKMSIGKDTKSLKFTVQTYYY